MYEDVLALIRKLAPEFKDVTDEQITAVIYVYADLVSKCYFGKFYIKALAFFIAHQLTLANVMENSEDGSMNNSVVGGNIYMEKEGDLQRQYSTVNNTSISEGDDLLNKTYYGKMFIGLRSALRPVGMMRKCLL